MDSLLPLIWKGAVTGIAGTVAVATVQWIWRAIQKRRNRKRWDWGSVA